MAFPGSMVVILLASLFRSTFPFPAFVSNNNGVIRGSARGIPTSCTCNAVEFWLRRKTGSSSELALPSFEELKPLTVATKEGYNRNYGGRRLRLMPQKNCKLLLKKDDVSSKLASVESRNMPNGSIEVWLANNGSDCLSFWMKCERESICVGIDVDISTDSHLSTKRKLLMLADGDQEEQNGFQSYAFLLSGLVLCAMVILVALCGSSPKKSEVCCPENEDIQVLSSTKITALPPQQPSASKDVAKPKNQENLAKKAETGHVVADQNSNKTSKSTIGTSGGFEDVDLDADKSPTKTEGDATDGQVFGKGAAKADKEEKKEGGSKEKDKHMRSKRSHTAPETESNPQAKSSRSFSKKLRISLKTHSSVEKDNKNPKKSKKKSGAENPSPPVSPTKPSPTGFQSDGRNRVSFIGRELPQRPADEPKYAEPFDAKPHTSVTSEDIEDEENYEQVINSMTGDAPVSAKEEIRGKSSGTAGAAEQRKSMNGDADDTFLYDSVNEQKAAGALPLDTYETVGESMKGGGGSLPDDVYEVVDKEKPSTLEIYEEPNALGRKRSFSDITGNSAPSTESEKKVKSLGRGFRLPSGAPPDPPPLAELQNVARLRHASHEDDKDLIDPYTVTKLQGDYILQETSTKDVNLPTAKQEAVPKSAKELEEMYAKVDKEKQKRDRLESQAEKDGQKEEEEGVLDVAKTETNTAEKPSSIGHDDESEHEYEALSDKKDEELHRDEGVIV